MFRWDSRYSLGFLARGFLAAALAFGYVASTLIVTAEDFSERSRDRAAIAGILAATLAFIAACRARMVAGVLAPLCIFATVGFGLWLSVSKHSLPLSLAAIIGSLLGASLYNWAGRHWLGVAALASIAILAILGSTDSRAAHQVALLFIGLFAACVTAFVSSYSAKVEDLVVGVLWDMRGLVGAALAFLVAYSLTAFTFALIYGVYFYAVDGALKYTPGGHPTLLAFFQWSLTVLVTAGTGEFEPRAPVLRAVYIVQVLANVFIMSFFVGYFVSHSKELLSKEEPS